jgi:riboflavin biosynthesis pyrimidine reductase
MVEGGPRLINSCINGYLGNYAHIMISTKIFGRGGRSFVDGPEKIAATVKEAKPLLVGRVSSFVTSEGDIVAEGNLK